MRDGASYTGRAMNTPTCLTLVGALVVLPLARLRQDKETPPLQLGNFSVSLTVKDIKASKAFYESLDFKQVGGNLAQNWVVLQNGTTTVGLFQGMFERNMLTFNPGWNHEKKPLTDFQDVRDIQMTLKDRGLTFQVEADEESDGPASFVLLDPDGNPILVDQFVPRPKAR